MSQLDYAAVKPYIPARPGHQVRVNHTTCPAGTDTRKRLYIRRTENGKVLAYCHNCSGHLVLSRKGTLLPIKQIESIIRGIEKESEDKRDVSFPPDINFNPEAWPEEARAWLYQYELDDRVIRNYTIGYSESLGRVIIPVLDGGTLVFWQGRSVDGAQPKYISMKGSNKPTFIAFAQTPAKSIVIVEDMVSAIKLAMSNQTDAVALLGTHSPDSLTDILKPYKHKHVWLDPDEAGRKAALRLTQQLSLVQTGVHNITGGCQPKEMPLFKLKSMVFDC